MQRGSAIYDYFRQEEYQKYKTILENSPGTGHLSGAARNRFAGMRTVGGRNGSIGYGVGGRSSLFSTSPKSSAINKTRFDRQVTSGFAQRISDKSAAIPGYTFFLTSGIYISGTSFPTPTSNRTQIVLCITIRYTWL